MVSTGSGDCNAGSSVDTSFGAGGGEAATRDAGSSCETLIDALEVGGVEGLGST